uniref:Proprotein convertase subtilisin/kexin type 5 n=1 Tax=Schistocephalus solidus TaxID=70667 RepID=A0A0V0J8S6_SCHSO
MKPCRFAMPTIILLTVTFIFPAPSMSNDDVYGALVDEFVMKVSSDQFEETRRALSKEGFQVVRKLLGHIDLYLVIPLPNITSTEEGFSRIKRSLNVPWIEQQRALRRSKRSFPVWNDPMYPDMWYLTRSSLNLGADMNVWEAWELGYTGNNSVVTIMDDGIDYTHPDLSQNYDKFASADINGHDADPMPNVTNKENKHGTRCAGQVAATGNNSVCIVGVAYNAKIGGIRMLDGRITDRVEAEALSHQRNYIDIYSGSWGPDDTGVIYEGPGTLASDAFQLGATMGRRGLGNVFVWASGNGGRRGDSCAADGYASSIYTLSVSSVSEKDTKPWYLEKCASTMVSTYSSGGPSERGIVTTDLNHECTTSHTGTSASAPIAAGIVALLLEANPNLTWRDVQYITVLTANSKPFRDGDFMPNAAGHRYSYYYGFGLMDAGKMVRLGELWRQLPPQHRCTSKMRQVSRSLRGLFAEVYALNFTGCRPRPSSWPGDRIDEEGEPVVFLEHVQLFLNIAYGHRGLLRIVLQSPSGTQSEIMPTRSSDAFSEVYGLDRWPLMSVQFWGEPAAGEWLIRIDNQQGYSQLPRWQKDQLTLNSTTARWESAYIVSYGTSSFPIRLRPPNPLRPPPQEWFESFAKYVTADTTTISGSFVCHNECANNDCWGPASNQCLSGCKHFVAEGGQCLAECPPATTTLVSFLIHNISGGVHAPGAAPALLCERCWVTCAECLRPHSSIDCIQCFGDSFLLPLLTPGDSPGLAPELAARLPNHALTDRLLVGSCVASCPVGYLANMATRICEPCPENCARCSGTRTTQCLICASGFRLVNGSCLHVATPEGRCLEGQFFQEGDCFDCPVGCASSSCSQDGACTYCSNTHRFMHRGACLPACPQGYFASQILSPQGLFLPTLPYESLNYTSTVWHCSPCPPGCTECLPSAKISSGYILPRCTACETPLQLDVPTGLCKSHCRLGFVNKQCSDACSPLCQTCIGHTSRCLECSPGAYLVHGELAINPLLPAEVFTATHKCDAFCPEGTYLHRAGEDQVCLKCPPVCATCSGPSACLTCADGFVKNPSSGDCELKLFCPPRTFYSLETMECIPCHSTCARCRGPKADDCLQCHRTPNSLVPPACLLLPDMEDNRQFSLQDISPFFGSCVPCCGIQQLLAMSPPPHCQFCPAQKHGCLTWASIGGGFLVEAPLSSSTGSGEAANISWSWLTEYPSRITLFVLCLVFLFAALGFIVYQVSIARCWRRQRHALSAMSMTRPCSSASRLSQHSPTAAGSPVLRINGHANGRITTAAMASENGEGDRLNPKYSKPESSLDQDFPPTPKQSLRLDSLEESKRYTTGVC